MRGRKKRAITLAMTAAAAITASLTVSAEISLEKAYDIEEGNFVGGSDLLILEENSGCYVASMDGKIKSQALYRHSIYNEYGMITVTRNEDEINASGALNKNGQEMIPTKYGALDILNKEWALGIVLKEATSEQYDYENFWSDQDTYYLIDTVDVYHVADGVATCHTTLARENFMEAHAYDSYINIKDRADGTVSTYDASFQKMEPSAEEIYDYAEGTEKYTTFSENGQDGIKDAAGTVILEPSFEFIYDFRYGYAEVDTGEKVGLVDEQGNVVLEPLYDRIETTYTLPYDEENGGGNGYCAYGYFSVEQDGKLGYVDAQGTMTMEPKYSGDAVENNGASALLNDLEGNQIILAADGTESIVEGYEQISPMNYGSGMYYKVQNADYQEGMIDWHGNVVIPCENSNVEISGDGKYVLVNKEYGDGSAVIYKIPDTETSQEEGAEAETETAGAETEGAAAETETAEAETEVVEAETEGAAAETEMAEAETEGAAANTDSAKQLLESAATLLENDSAETRTSVKILVQQAADAVDGQNEAASLLIENVISLLETEGSDAASIKALLSSAVALL